MDEYGAKVIKYLNDKQEQALLVLSKERTNEFLHDHSDYFELFANGMNEEIILNIVDTAGFQRLRNVNQTSYSPLYSSAVHNRFVHFLGVYHLGCIVSLLNSAVIDVDKLDYLIRDANINGFDTVSIDYVCLLLSIRFRKEEQKYQVVYTKSAISVIENVVYTHAAERKWIQNHSVVQYEAYLLQSAIEELKNKYAYMNLFSYEALTEEGVKIFDDYKISLLCDANITFL